MTQIILDANAISQLDALTRPVEVCDPAGRVVGKFVPNAADDFDPRGLYPLVDKTMADADPGDPTLESYQHYSNEGKP
jgi:hypothetical protein